MLQPLGLGSPFLHSSNCIVASLTIFDLSGGGRYALSQHPEVEARVVQELDALGLLVTPDRHHTRKPEYADIARLTYLKCVIKVRCCLSILPCHSSTSATCSQSG